MIPATHDELAAAVEAIAPLPTAVVELASVAVDDDPDPKRVTEIVLSDPGLLFAVLRAVNSAAASPSGEIADAAVAVRMLGTTRTLGIAVMGCVGHGDRPLEAYGTTIEGLWDHARRVSRWITEIRELSTVPIGAHAQAATIMHDLGKPILDDSLRGRNFPELVEVLRSSSAAERELVEVDHAEVGALLVERWGLPASIASAIRHHHEPGPDADPAAHAIVVADAIEHDRVDLPVVRASAEALGLPLQRLGSLRRAASSV